MGRHLLNPVGSETPAGVVRRLGAVLAIIELAVTVTWLAERPRPRTAVERETSRLATVLVRDLRLTVSP